MIGYIIEIETGIEFEIKSLYPSFYVIIELAWPF